MYVISGIGPLSVILSQNHIKVNNWNLLPYHWKSKIKFYPNEMV